MFSFSGNNNNNNTAPNTGFSFGGGNNANTTTANNNNAFSFGNNSNAPAGNSISSSTTGGLFGNKPASTGGLFGNKPASTGGLFGNNNAATGNTTGGGLFGNNNAATGNTTGGGLFGNNNAATGNTTGGGLFGNNNAATGNTTGGGLFGNNNAATGNITGGGLFGNNNAATGNTTGGGLFGNNNAATNTGTGGGLFGNKPASSGGLFNSNNATTNTTAGGGLFSNNNATTNTGTSGGLFGNKPTSSGGLFAGNNVPNSNTTGGLFGTNRNANAVPTTGNLFNGSTTANNNMSLFGKTTQPSFAWTQGSTTQQAQQQQAQQQQAQQLQLQQQAQQAQQQQQQQLNGLSTTYPKQIQDKLIKLQDSWSPASSESKFKTFVYNKLDQPTPLYHIQLSKPSDIITQDEWDKALMKRPGASNVNAIGNSNDNSNIASTTTIHNNISNIHGGNGSTSGIAPSTHNDVDYYVPVLITSPQQLQERIALQVQTVAQYRTIMNNLIYEQHLSSLKDKHDLDTSVRIIKSLQFLKTLESRLWKLNCAIKLIVEKTKNDHRFLVVEEEKEKGEQEEEGAQRKKQSEQGNYTKNKNATLNMFNQHEILPGFGNTDKFTDADNKLTKKIIPLDESITNLVKETEDPSSLGKITSGEYWARISILKERCKIAIEKYDTLLNNEKFIESSVTDNNEDSIESKNKGSGTNNNNNFDKLVSVLSVQQEGICYLDKVLQSDLNSI